MKVSENILFSEIYKENLKDEFVLKYNEKEETVPNDKAKFNGIFLSLLGEKSSTDVNLIMNKNTLKRLSVTFDIKEENPTLNDAQIKIQDEPDNVIIIENQIYDPCKKRVIHHTIEDPREIENDEDLHEIEDEMDKDH